MDTSPESWLDQESFRVVQGNGTPREHAIADISGARCAVGSDKRMKLLADCITNVIEDARFQMHGLKTPKTVFGQLITTFEHNV